GGECPALYAQERVDGIANETRIADAPARCYLRRPMREIDLFPLWLSLQVAAASTLFVAVSGVALAWLLARKNFFGREALDAFLTLPLVLPPTVLGYYLLVL